MSRPGRTTWARPIAIGSGVSGTLLAAEVQRLVLDEHDRVRVGDRAGEQPGGVGGGARHHHLQPRDVGQPGLEALGVLGAAALARSALRPEHQRHRQLSAGHEVRLRGLVGELVEREREEVDEHDLDDRPQPGLGGTDRHAADRALADRRVQHAVASELVRETGRDQVRAALGDVLPEHDHALVGAHRPRERGVDRGDERRLLRRVAHRESCSSAGAYTIWADSSGSGNGLSRANCTAASHRGGGLGLDRRRLVGVDPLLRQRPGLEARQRIALSPLLVRQRIAVLLRVALVVAAAAVGEALEQERPAAGSRGLRGSVRTPPRSPARPRRRRCWRSKPYGATTSLTRSTTVCAERGVNSAKPLFSQTKITGSAHSAARLTDSLKWPAWTAPSPKNTTVTCVGAR